MALYARSTTVEGSRMINPTMDARDHIRCEWLGTPGESPSAVYMCGVEVLRNNSNRPHATIPWYTNNKDINPILVNYPVPSPHPNKIPTCVRQYNASARSGVLTVYNIDGLRNTDNGVTPTLYRGFWIYPTFDALAYLVSTGPKTVAPKFMWTFVSQPIPSAGNVTAYAASADGSILSEGSLVYATGSISTTIPITTYFDGDTKDPETLMKLYESIVYPTPKFYLIILDFGFWYVRAYCGFWYIFVHSYRHSVYPWTRRSNNRLLTSSGMATC